MAHTEIVYITYEKVRCIRQSWEMYGEKERVVPLLGIALISMTLFSQTNEARFAGFCSDRRLAESVCVGSSYGDNDLDGCIFNKTRSVRQCAKILNVDSTTLKKIRSRRSYFAMSGHPWEGYCLDLSQRHAQEMQQSPYNWYAEIIRTQQEILAGEAGLRAKQFLDESNRRKAEGKEPLQWGGCNGAQIVSAGQVDSIRVCYALLIGNALQRSKRRDVIDYLHQEQNAALSKVGNLPAWRTAQHLQQMAISLADEAVMHPRMGSGWKAVMFHSYYGSISFGRIEVFIEDRNHAKITEWMDKHEKIFPWLKLALEARYSTPDSSNGAVVPPARCAQPAMDAEPEFDREEYDLIKQGNGYRLYMQPVRLREFAWSDDDIAKLEQKLITKLSLVENR